MTTYKVFRQTAGQWEEVADFEAAAAPAAERDAAKTTGVEGTYVAVPVRSWNPSPQVKETIERWTTGEKKKPKSEPALPIGSRPVATVGSAA